ncbi:HipA N-terminal domain-containing protein [Pontibacter harenae]|uniref:HipA N-terminal domain-containing protein n=1 Tax=Pontibacter harenae TaxID=2894083 RepID=UPI001E42F4EF|nr:HipA N-terminal domain-containing protein [Pontibacter harenae]MCC9167988.1 HipA N-terminal domain-containing protein [Pontibacter harenae]
MRIAQVYWNDILAGTLTEVNPNEYIFCYDNAYFIDSALPAISLTLPKRQQVYKSNFLFPFFFNMLAEGVNRNLQNRQLRIDEHDYFSLLMATAQYDTIGAITIKPEQEIKR